MAKGLSRESIVMAALAVLDSDGIDAVTVRAVADRLGVRAPALYWHVANKQELLDEMGTEIQRRVVATVGSSDADQSWREALATYARVLRREYLAHRDGARTFSGTRLTDPEVLRAQEPWLRRWQERGVPVGQAVRIAGLVTAFVVGFVIEEQERSQGGLARYSVAEREQALGADVPLVNEAGRVLYGDADGLFESELGMLLDGVGVSIDRRS